MAAVAVTPFVLNDVTLKVDADNFEAALSAVEFVPSSSIVTFKGMTPTSVHTLGTTATWTCNLTFAQDWETVGSLSQYLLANEGNAVVAEFYPKAGGTGFTATIIVTPGAIGGPGDAIAVATVSLGVSGKPAVIVAV